MANVDTIKSPLYFPMLVSEEGTGIEEPSASTEAIWEKLRNLPEDKRDILISKELSLKLEALKETLRLDDKSVGCISLVTRKIFFGELDFSGAEAKISAMFVASGIGDPGQAKTIVEFIQEEILTIRPVKRVPPPEENFFELENATATVRLPLLKAMSEYKHVADQMITSEKIKLRNSMELVRPTLSNWIRSYREELGIGFHEPVKRGGFLFQSQNGKKLTNEDRAKLNLILKSIEEGFPLDIDPKKELIIFPAGSDASMGLTQVNTSGRPVANRVIRPRAMPVGTVRPASFAPGMTPALGVRPAPVIPPKPTPAAPILANLKPLFSKSAAPEKNISGETLHFSTGHVLPAEKASEKTLAPTTPTAPPVSANQPVQHPVHGIKREPGASLPKSPYTIRPLRLRNDDRP